MKSDEREKMIITVGRYQHTLVEQGNPEKRPEWQKGAYMGKEGWVLQSIKKLRKR